MWEGVECGGRPGCFDQDALTKMMGSKGPKSFNGKQLNALPEKEKKEGDWWYRARVTEV